MRRNIFAICDAEAEYTVSFAEYVGRKKNFPFYVQAFTSTDRLKSYAEEHKIHVLLIAEESMSNEVPEMNIERIIILSEGIVRAEYEQYPKISKYQSMEQILREVMTCCKDEEGEGIYHLKKDTEIISVYSPIHRCGRTAAALAIGQMMARNRQTLYLNFEEYSGFEALTGRNSDSDLSDLLYDMKHDGNHILMKLSAMVITVNGLDMVPPAGTPWDLRVIDFEDLRRLLEVIVKNSGYETVVLDIGSEFDNLFQLLELSDAIYMPTMEDEISVCKMKQYEKLLEVWSYTHLMDKTVRITPGKYSAEGKGESYMESLLWGEFGEYIKTIIENDIDNGKISL